MRSRLSISRKQRRSRNAAATMRGWDVGTLRSRDISSDQRTTFSYFVTVGRTIFAPRHVKVALAWDSKITTFSILGINLLLDPRWPWISTCRSSIVRELRSATADRGTTATKSPSSRASRARPTRSRSGAGLEPTTCGTALRGP